MREFMIDPPFEVSRRNRSQLGSFVPTLFSMATSLLVSPANDRPRSHALQSIGPHHKVSPIVGGPIPTGLQRSVLGRWLAPRANFTGVLPQGLSTWILEASARAISASRFSLSTWMHLRADLQLVARERLHLAPGRGCSSVGRQVSSRLRDLAYRPAGPPKNGRDAAR